MKKIYRFLFVVCSVFLTYSANAEQSWADWVKSIFKRNYNLDTSIMGPKLFQAQDLATVEKLVADGIGVNIRDRRGNSALHVKGDEAILSFLINKAGADIKAENSNGETVLFNLNMTPTIVQMLIEKGLDINAKNRDGKTPLQQIFEYAIEYIPFCSDAGKEMRERIKKFVDMGADMSWFDPDKAGSRSYYYDVTPYFKLMNKLFKKEI